MIGGTDRGRAALCVALLAVLAFAIRLGHATESQAETTPPPNVLVIVSDDQPTGMVKRMPVLDSAEGFTRFNSYYDNNPLCCPTRSTLLTGLYSHHTGSRSTRTRRRSMTPPLWPPGSTTPAMRPAFSAST